MMKYVKTNLHLDNYTILIKRKPSRLLLRSGELRLRDAHWQYQSSLPQSPPRSTLANPDEGPKGAFEGLSE